VISRVLEIEQKRKAFQTAKDLYDQGQLRESLPYFQQALKEQPADVDVMYRAMLTLMAMRDYAGCARWLTELLPHVNPRETPTWMMGGFHYNLGVAHEASGQWSAAETHFQKALEYEPNAALPTIEMGSLAYRKGDPFAGRAWHQKAREMMLNDDDAKPAQAFVHLLHGDYQRGFALYESRWKLPQVIAHTHIPKDHWRWKGKDLKGKRIVVVCEQGIGDTIQMVRYLPLIEARGGKITLIVQPSLKRLLQHNFPSVEVKAQGEPYRAARWWVSLMSLPYLFGTTLETIPPAPYLKAPEPRLTISDVGYVSRGNPLHMGDKDRSCHSDAFNVLANRPKTIHLDEFALRDSLYACKDFQDTAEVIAGLKAVVAIDSAVAHLAGALGVPCFVAVPCAPEWRHGLPSDKPWSPAIWYPRSRSYWRRHVDDWPGVIARIMEDLPGA
jgi:Flp pilus assembly protein TadD